MHTKGGEDGMYEKCGVIYDEDKDYDDDEEEGKGGKK